MKKKAFQYSSPIKSTLFIVCDKLELLLNYLQQLHINSDNQSDHPRPIWKVEVMSIYTSGIISKLTRFSVWAQMEPLLPGDVAFRHWTNSWVKLIEWSGWDECHRIHTLQLHFVFQFQCKPGTGRNHYLLFTWAQLLSMLSTVNWWNVLCKIIYHHCCTNVHIMHVFNLFPICIEEKHCTMGPL